MARTRKKANARHAKKSTTVAVAIDPAMKRAYAALTKVIAKTSKSEMRDFDARWEAAGAIVEHRPALYLVGGYATADEFYRGVMHEEPRVAQRYVRVAKYASPAEETVYGVRKLEAAIGFVEAKIGQPLLHPPLPISFERLRVPVGGGTKSLADAKESQVRAATSAITKRGHKRPKSAAHAAIALALSNVASLKDVNVHERDGFVSFQRIPVAALHHFLAALTHAASKLR